jgi:catechol 2,3-dioxygenase-like lactoylglutathione lyase family enzyme
MADSIKSSRDIILRTRDWAEALLFYETVLGFKVIHRSETIVGFETGSFCLYVEKGVEHGPVFDFLTPNIQAAKKRLVAAGCVLVEEDASVPRCYLKDPFGLVFNLGTKDSGTK